MSPRQLAAHDQSIAKERESERRAGKIAAVILYAFLALAAYSWAGLNGLVPAPPWAPAGQIEQPVDAPTDPSEAPVEHEFEIPDGYEPAVPVESDPAVGV